MVNILKVYYKDSRNEEQIRRMVVNSDVVSKFELFKEKIQTLLQLSNCTSLQIKWKDPEEDLILISSDDELAQALANAEDSLLKVYVAHKVDWKKVATGRGSCCPMTSLVICDGCEKNISGVRYKCLQCKNFDLCPSCNAANEHPQHDMIKLTKPITVPRQWVFLGARKMWKSMFGPYRNTVITVGLKDSSNSSDDYQSPQKENCQEKMEQEPATNSDGCKRKGFHQKSTASGFTADFEFPMNDDQAKDEHAKHAGGKNKTAWSPDSTLPGFLDFLKGAVPPPHAHSLFEDTCKIINDNLGNVFKNVQGKVEVKVDSPLFTSNFKMGQPSHETNDDENKSSAEHSPPSKETGPEKSPSTLKEKCQAAATKYSKAHAPDINNEAVPPCPATPLAPANAASDRASDASPDTCKTDKALSSVVTETPPAHATEAESCACAEDWTFLNEEGAKQPEPSAAESTGKEEVKPIYPELKKFGDNHEKQDAPTKDPVIVSALTAMEAMGFTNEGGWLERLLISKHGSITEALDALYPLACNDRQ